MDIQFAMSRFGFGHRETKHLIIDHDDELWLAGAPVISGGSIVSGGTGLPGILRIEPLTNGDTVPFTYIATEAFLDLTTGKGAKVMIAIDKDAQAIRITGDTPIRLNGSKAVMGMASLITTKGISLKAGGNRYLFTAKKGSISFDDTWLLDKRHSAVPVLNIEPEGGSFELCIYDLPPDIEVPIITKPFDECIAENKASFRMFTDELVDIPAEWNDVKKKIAYVLWLCHRVLDGKEVVVENKYNSRNTSAKQMAIASMPFKDVVKAIDMITAYPADLPPVAALAAARLLEENMLNDSRGEIYRVYSALDMVARKCINRRTVEPDGLSCYFYRFESGEDKSPEFFEAGEPVYAPDLNAWLILAGEVMSKLTSMEYDVGAEKKWDAYAKEMKTKLFAVLWDGEDFIGKNAYSGEVSGPDKLLSLVPLVLGSRLPGGIIRKLARKIGSDISDSLTGLLIIGGLYDAGEKDAAKEITLKTLESIRTEGIACPFYGAALLALAYKVL